MLENTATIRKVVIACGYVNLRKGIDGRSDQIKGLLWVENGFLLLYKCLESRSLS